jgi:hypothetical protein
MRTGIAGVINNPFRIQHKFGCTDFIWIHPLGEWRKGIFLNGKIFITFAE